MAEKELKPAPKTGASRNTPRAASSGTNGGARRGAESQVEERSPFSVGNIRTGCMHSALSKLVLGLLILIFAVGFLFSNLSPQVTNPGPNGRLSPGPDPVARVAGQDIGRDELNGQFAQQVGFYEQIGQPQAGVQLLETRNRTLDNLVSQAAQYKAAQDAGFSAADDEVTAKLNKEIDDEIKSQEGSNPAAFRRKAEATDGSVQAFRDKLLQQADTPDTRAQVAKQLIIEKLQNQIQDAAKAKVTEDDYKRSVTRYKLRQIVIRPKPVMPPLPPQVKPGTPAPKPVPFDFKAAQDKAALEVGPRAAKIAKQLGANPTAAQFAQLAKTQSDDVATKAKGGDLGAKLPTEFPFSQATKDAILSAKGNFVGPIQDDVSKEGAIYFIENRKLELPKDYAKKKAQLLKDFKTSKGSEAWTKYQDDLKKGVTPELLDPALVAYHAQTTDLPKAATPDAQNTLRTQILDNYTQSLSYSPPILAAAIHGQMAQLYRETNQPAKVLESLQAAAKEAPSDSQTQIDLARALIDANQKPAALKTLQELSQKMAVKPPARPSPFGGGNPDDNIRQQLSSEFSQLGRQDLAAAERKKIKPAAPQSNNFGGNMGANGVQVVPGR